MGNICLTETCLRDKVEVQGEENNDREKLQVNFNIHTKSSDMLQEWFVSRSNEIMCKILKQAGTQIMAGIVENNVPKNEREVFSDELMNFDSDNPPKKDPFGLMLAWQQKDKSSVLLERIKEYDFENQTIDRIREYIPTEHTLNVTCNVYFVLTGWEWGDAMVHRITKTDNLYRVTDHGEPIIIINLSIITKLYGEESNKLLNDVICNLMSHELFHLVFEKIKSTSKQWRKNKEPTRICNLIELIQNEGIAHYLSNNQKQNLIKSYNHSSELKEHEKVAFQRLNVAVKQLLDSEVSAREKNHILARANTGKYWEKFGAIVGKFMVYHIESKYGEQAIRESILKGAYFFIELYNKVQIERSGLPMLTEELVHRTRKC